VTSPVAASEREEILGHSQREVFLVATLELNVDQFARCGFAQQIHAEVAN